MTTILDEKQQEIERLTTQRDELLAALTQLNAAARDQRYSAIYHGVWTRAMDNAVDVAAVAIAHVEAA